MIPNVHASRLVRHSGEAFVVEEQLEAAFIAPHLGLVIEVDDELFELASRFTRRDPRDGRTFDTWWLLPAVTIPDHLEEA